MSDETKLTDKQQSAIDKVLAKAKLAEAAKLDAAANAKAEDKPAKAKKGTKKADKAPAKGAGKKAPAKKADKPDPKAIEAAKAEKAAAREAKKAARETERAAAKAARDAARAVKKAEKAASTKPAHLGKVDKAGAKLPTLSDAARATYDLVTGAGLDEGQMAVLVAHLAHFNRRAATIRSLTSKLEVGQTVTVVSSDRDAKLIGRTGTVTQVRKIRVLVDLGGKKPAYLFCSDVAPVAASAEEDTAEPQFLTPEAPEAPATGTEGN